MFFIGLTLIGIIAFNALPVEMMPNTTFGDITINIDVRGGIPAAEVEKRIAIPVEEAVGSVTYLKNILAISKEGNCTVILEFEPGINMDFASLEVREKFNRIRNKLPPEIEKPVIAKYEYLDVPIMIIAVTSDRRTPEQLRKVVDDSIRDRIQRIEGVARAEVAGGRESKVLIEIDQSKLQAYNLPINRVVDIINVNNANLLAGEIKRAKDKYLIRTIGEFQNLADIGNLAISTTKEGSVIRLRDIAEIKDSYLEPTGLARLNAQPVVSIYVQKESQGNTVKIAKIIHKEVKELGKILDSDIKITPTFNQAEAIEQAVNQVKSSLIYGAILSTVVLLFFLRDWRSVFIIASSMPLSILITFCCMYFNKLTINVMSLSGLALGVGMLVDNAIVVLDNIFKKRANALAAGMTMSEKDLAIIGADEMLLAITASTATTVVVFLPLVFINPEIRLLYSGIALTITYSLVASLFAALTLVPMMAARMRLRSDYEAGATSSAFGEKIKTAFQFMRNLRDKILHVPMRAIGMQLRRFIYNPLKAIVARINLLLYKAIYRPFLFIKLRLRKKAKVDSIAEALPSPEEQIVPDQERKGAYQRFINGALTLRYLIVVLAALAFVRVLFETKHLEKEFIGIAEQNKFTVFIELPTGAKLDISDKIVAQVEKIISRLPEVKTSTAKIEPWSSKIYVELYPLSKRKRPTADIMNSLRPLTEKLDPAFIYYEEAEEVGTKEILIELYGYDYDVLKSLAIQTAQRIQSIPKFTDTKIRMREGRPEMRLAIDKRQAAMFGLTVEDIALALHTQMRGLVATRFRGISEPIIRVKDQTQVKEEKAPSSSTEEQKILEQKTKEMRTMRLGSPSGETRELETIARLEEKFRRTFADLRRISFTTPDGNQVYLSQLASFKFDLGPSEIWRKNKSRMVQVSANTGGLALGTAAEKVQEVLKDYRFPKDYFWQFGGNYDKMIRNQRELTFAIVLSLILVFMLLASLFESFSQPFIILMTVPLAAIGAIIALRMTHKPVGTGALIGGIMLGGMVVNKAIVLVDRINFLKHRRTVEKTTVSDREIIVIASHDRLRPIMMTSLTTILGLIPMALDKSESSNLWSPLAITAIGGETVSTVLTLFVIPCVYLIFKDLKLIRK